MLKSKKEEIITSTLRLILTLIRKSEIISKTLEPVVDHLLDVLLGPKLPCCQYSVRVSFFVLEVLRQMLKYNHKLKEDKIMKNLDSLQSVVELV